MTNLGFVALGIMGRPMAGHLAAAGHAVHVSIRKLLEFKTSSDVENYFSELCKIQLEYHTIFRYGVTGSGLNIDILAFS